MQRPSRHGRLSPSQRRSRNCNVAAVLGLVLCICGMFIAYVAGFAEWADFDGAAAVRLSMATLGVLSAACGLTFIIAAVCEASRA